jgi:CRP/FNR family cyclic AMP-dependent transcriptional regulator
MTPQDLLRLHPFFSGLSSVEIDALAARSATRNLAAGRTLFHEGTPGDGLYGLLSGRIAFTIDSRDGRNLILNTAGPGEFFGEIALLDGGGRSAGAIARDASRVLFIPRDKFLAFVRERPPVMLHIMAVLCGRLRRSTDYIADAAFMILAQRLAKQLLQMAGDATHSPAQSPAELRVSHAELAAMLGVSRGRVSRQLAEWQEAKILEQKRGRLRVRDRAALKRVVAE